MNRKASNAAVEPVDPGGRDLTPEEIAQAVENERRWLRENNAISEVFGGPVEDMQGVPLPADLHQGTPPAHSDKSQQ